MKNFQYLIEGDFVSQNAFEIKNKLMQLIAEGTKNLTLDLSKSKEVDVVGINALVKVYTELRNAEGTLEIKLLKNSPLAQLLHVTKFDKIFTLTFQ